MSRDVLDHYEAFPDPSPSIVPISAGPLETMDDALHFGWAWQRYRFTYRKTAGINILDAGCGTGVSTLTLSRLNPGATVTGVDFSQHALGLARQRIESAEATGITFHDHNLENPLPADWGKFGFIVTKNVLGNGGNVAAILANLTAALTTDGLLLATFPSNTGRLPVRQMQRAIDALVGPDASSTERAEAGLDLLKLLKNDHPIKRYDASRHGIEPPTIEQFAATYLNDVDQTGTLEGVSALLEAAGLRVLLVHDRGVWRPDRVFQPAISPSFKERVGKLSEERMALLRDALDVNLNPDSYFIYSSRADFEPHIPAWPEDLQFSNFDTLTPHLTHLAAPAKFVPDPANSRGSVTYRAANGALNELDIKSDQALRRVDGKKTLGEIEAELSGTPMGGDDKPTQRAKWFALANRAYVLLEAANPRENVDCIHLGAIKDRLDCACPRRWVRACDRHEFCTISKITPDDSKSETLRLALVKLGRGEVAACDRCNDYTPED